VRVVFTLMLARDRARIKIRASDRIRVKVNRQKGRSRRLKCWIASLESPRAE